MQFAVFTVDWSLFDQSKITIQRHVKGGTNVLNEPVFSLMQVYAGSANVFDVNAEMVLTEAGLIANEQITVIIDGIVPPIQVGDVVTVTSPGDGTPSHRYIVEHAHIWDFPPASVELRATMDKTQ